MAFGISGFGATQTAVTPQVFQALSLGGKRPVPPAPPYGTPNQNLVPVALSGNPAVPANLTLAAHAAFQAVLRVTSQSVVAVGHPPLPANPNTTTAISATNPSVQQQLQGPTPAGIPVIGNPPQGPVSFSLTVAPASVTSGINALTQTVASFESQQQAQRAYDQAAASNTNAAPANPGPAGNANSAPAPSPAPAPVPQSQPAPAPAPVGGGSAHGSTGHTPTIPAAASPSLIAKVVQTVQNLAISAVYPGPVFSFSA